MRPFSLVRAVYLPGIAALLYGAWTQHLSWVWPILVTVTYLGVLAAGATRIQWRFFIPSLLRGSKDERSIALSFDDGPAAFTDEILGILHRERVPAAFFAIGHRVDAAPDMARRWHAEGHLIGNHSYTHSFGFDWKTARAMEAELRDTNRAIEAATGLKPLLFRPPYGVTNPALAKAVRRCGMVSTGWSLRSFDTRAKDPQLLLERILTKLKNGDVILLHDSMQVTAGVLTALIQACRQKGFTFVRLDELLRVKPYA